MNLRNNNSFLIDLRGPSNGRFSGTWRESGRDQYALQVNGGLGSDGANGSGQIYFRNGEFDRLEMNGNSVRTGERFDVRFSSSGSGGSGSGGSGGFFPGAGGGSGSGGDISLQQFGRGTIDDGNSINVTWVSVQINGGNGTILARTERGDVRMDGNVVNTSAAMYELELTRSNRGSVNGRARIFINRNSDQINSVRIDNGQINGKSFRLTFAR